MSQMIIEPSIALETERSPVPKYLTSVIGALWTRYDVTSVCVWRPICQSLTSQSNPPVSKKLQSRDGLKQVTPYGTKLAYLLATETPLTCEVAAKFDAR